MPEGGRLLIETANAECPDHNGPCVSLIVSDTGVGMTEEVRQKVFEPFFTTKEQGRGTGLGLAMVYGIVSQSGGSIRVDSQPGHGTCFRICFPRTEAGEPLATPPPTAAQPAGGTETVLVVEDQEAVRTLAARILKSAGYRILTAAGAEQAFEIAVAHQGAIDLLLTDVVLPTINGRQLAERIRARYPGIRVLYTSGYSDDVIANRGVLNTGLSYLAKPFSPESLLGKVREVLETTPG
jgi:CheY-like chemotaxis protein